jgi:hypothetical protein
MSTEMSDANRSGTPGKYKRSAQGLAVSLVVTVVAIVVVTWAMGLFRNETEIAPEQVDHLEAIEGVQTSGARPVYPAELPEGWIATGVDVEPGESPAYGIKMLTDAEQFVGIRQEDASVGTLLATYVDEETQPADGYSTGSSVAEEWEGYTDEGGDTAYAAEVGDDVVLVYGSAPAEDLQDVIDRLTREPLT